MTEPNDTRKNMCMIQVMIPDIPDDEAIKIKNLIVDATSLAEGVSVDLRLRNSKDVTHGHLPRLP